MGGLTDFYLVGHSFGGYVAGLYALAYPQHIRKVLFISPIGFSRKPNNWSFERVKMRKVKDHKGNLVERHPMINPSSVQQAIAPYVWSYSVCPQKLGRTLGRRISRIQLKNFVKTGMHVDDIDLAQIVTDYLMCIFLMRGTSESALFLLFEQGLFAHEPLCSPKQMANPEFSLPVSFIFGKHDWVTATGCEDVILSNKFRKSGHSQLHVINKSGHDVANDNPAALA